MSEGESVHWPQNAFGQTMLGLEFTAVPGEPADLFSRACAEQYREFDPDRFGYLFAQVFEANVLVEIALCADVPYDSLAGLDHRPTASMARLADSAANAADLSVVGAINVAAALISVSRFDLATKVLAIASAKSGGPREDFEAWMLAFIVANRCEDAARVTESFARMREAMETGGVPPARGLDASAQAVVWYMKRKALPENDFRWYLATGERLADLARVDSAAVSSWYRALAMVPAAAGDARRTREYMVRAREAARETISRRPRAYELHLLKTYFESSLKEFMYVTPDFDRAAETGRALIDLDPAWAPSYGEVAEAYLRFGKVDQAAGLYDRAVAAGPPYYGHHLLSAARAHEKCGNTGRALTHYETLSRLVPDNAAVLTAGLALARGEDREARTHFTLLLEQLESTKAGH